MANAYAYGTRSTAGAEPDDAEARFARDFAAAVARGKAEEARPSVQDARYDPSTGLVELVFNNGCRLAFPARLGQGLEDASPEALAEIEIWGGQGLHWPRLDVDLLVPALLTGVFGTTAHMDRLRAARAGSVSTPRKAAAVRANGAKGGRPRKTGPKDSA